MNPPKTIRVGDIVSLTRVPDSLVHDLPLEDVTAIHLLLGRDLRIAELEHNGFFELETLVQGDGYRCIWLPRDCFDPKK